MNEKLQETDFDVALSYATEDENYVKSVAKELRNRDIRVYFAPNAQTDMWGKDMYVYLDEIYRVRAKYTVMFISRHYAKKLWTNHERQSAQARAFEENKEYILPVKFDDTEIPGLRRTTGYIDLSKITPKELADKIVRKIGPLDKVDYFPRNIDQLYKVLKVTNPQEKIRLSRSILFLFDSFSLMTPNEREIIAHAVIHTCEAGYPEDVHLRLDLLARLAGVSEDDVEKTLSRLNSLNFLTTINEEDHSHDRDGTIASNRKMVSIKFYPYFSYEYKGKEFDGKNSTKALYGYYRTMIDRYCRSCVLNRFKRNDFGSLNPYAYKEK